MQKFILKLTLICTVIIHSVLIFAADKSISNYDDLYKRINELHEFRKKLNASIKVNDKSWMEDPQKRKQLILWQKRERQIIFYLQNRPENLVKLEKKLAPEISNCFFSKYSGLFALTRLGEICACKWKKKIIEQRNKSNFDRKHALLRFATSRCGLGMESTQDLINYTEKTYPKPELKELFQSYPPFLKKYGEFKTAVKNNVELFMELAEFPDNVSDEKLDDEWHIIMFSYAQTHIEENFGLKNKKNAKKKTKKDGDPIENFLADFFKAYKNRYRSNGIVPYAGRIKKLFKKMAERGGKYDFNSEKIIKNITAYTNEYGVLHKGWGDRYGRMSVQTIITDDKGKTRYIFSFSNALINWSQRNSYDNVLDHHLPMVFYLAKVIYKDGKPVDLVSTEIYADQELKELLNTSVRKYFTIDLEDLGKRGDGGPIGVSAYDLKGFPFSMEVCGFYRLDYDFPRKPGNKFSKVCGGKEREDSIDRNSRHVGTDLTPERGGAE